MRNANEHALVHCPRLFELRKEGRRNPSREQARQRGLAEKFEDILVPTEQVVEVRRGRKINSERKFFPGYVLVKCDLTDEVYHLIKNTPKVTGFLGADKKPMPISDLEADRIKGQVADGVERPKAAIRFEIGENVRVADGPFASFNGVVEEVDESRFAGEGRGVDLRPGDAGRSRIRPGREGLSGSRRVGRRKTKLTLAPAAAQPLTPRDASDSSNSASDCDPPFLLEDHGCAVRLLGAASRSWRSGQAKPKNPARTRIAHHGASSSDLQNRQC